MSDSLTSLCSAPPALQVYLLGTLEYGRALALQQRLASETARRGDGPLALLLCEHPPVITVGRDGSAAGLPLGSGVVRSGRLPVRWVNRGGGVVLHAPGQLAIYPIVPLERQALSVGRYLDLIQASLERVLLDLGITAHAAARGDDLSAAGDARYGLWGRTGQLAALGVAVRNWVSYHGAFLNVGPAMGLFRLLEGDLCNPQRWGSLVAEHGRSVRMTSVRSAVIARLSEALGCDRFHLHTGHPSLKAM